MEEPADVSSSSSSSSSSDERGDDILTLHDVPEHARVCLSDVHVASSTLDEAGNGLFASKTFQVGDVVSASPILPVHVDDVHDSVRGSVFINYAMFGDDRAEVLWMPMGLLALANHGHPGVVNVEIQCYDGWKGRVTERCGELNLDRLEEASVSDAPPLSSRDTETQLQWLTPLCPLIFPPFDHDDLIHSPVHAYTSADP